MAERIASAARSVLVKEGEPAVTMRRVAGDVGLSAMAPYRHFANRAELLQRVSDDEFARLESLWGRRIGHDAGEERIFELLDEFLDFALGTPNLYRFLLTERRDNARRFPKDFPADASTPLAPLVRVVEQAMRADTFRSDDPVEVAQCISAQTIGLVQLYLQRRMSLPEAEFRDLCRGATERLLTGLRA